MARGSVPPAMIVDSADLTSPASPAGPIDTKQFITDGRPSCPGGGIGGSFRRPIARQNLVAVTVTVDSERGVANQIAPVTTSTS